MLNFREKNCENVAKINGKIVRKKYGREIINYDIIKLLMLQALRLENSSSFFAQLIVSAMFFRGIFFLANLFFAKFRKKVCEIRTNIFAFFRESFRSLETLS